MQLRIWNDEMMYGFEAGLRGEGVGRGGDFTATRPAIESLTNLHISGVSDENNKRGLIVV